jgi:DNA-binding response OmpR family regulator
VPRRSKSSAIRVPQPSILLLEEYDALAAAISSALKKFAPKHASAVARSFAEAERLAANVGPELFVLDVDPPWFGLTDFLQEISSTHPNARVLVIGSAIPAEIAAQRGQTGALQFIEKPFDLAVFGAAVQALLGPWREQEGRGTLGGLNALDVVLAHCAANANVALELDAGRRTGEIQIASGQVVHAATGKLKGEDALDAILGWSRPHLSERKLSGSTQRTISNWRTVVVESLRGIGPESSEHEEPVPEPEARPTKAGKKLVVVDDTEMLLIFVEDTLATADPSLQITTALSATDGFREIERLIPDLVLLDYSLPDFNGDELCERLLQSERTARVPVLMMSGHVPEMNAAAARLPNVVAKIEKPFLSDALVDLVQRTLRAKHQLETRIEEKRVEPEILILEREPAPEPPPSKKRIVAEAARHEAAAPPLAPVQAHIERHTPVAAPPIRVPPTDANAAVLGIFLEVLSMQLTSQLQMGAIRARPSLIASLRLTSAGARNAIPSELGFQLGSAKLNRDGRISKLRLIPTSKPFQPGPTRTAFEIGGVALIPNETRTHVQLTPAGTTPMTMELFAHLELDAVELSASFQVAQLILNWDPTAVRITLNPKAPEQTAARFEMRVLKLDDSGRMQELLLSPIR